MNEIAAKILEQIEQADSIVIFRHINPDPDALGSQLGLKEAILALWPEKTVLAAGQGDMMDEVSDGQIAGSLCIVTDTATDARVDDGRYRTASRLARIDHHVKVEDFGPLDLVEEEAAAACEVEALMLRDAGWNIGAAAAQHLLEGLMADTQRFTIPSVSSKTFEAASWLAAQGADASLAAARLFSVTYPAFGYDTLIRQKAVRHENFLFSVLEQADYLRFGIPYEEAKNCVNVLGSIEGVQIWAIFTEQPDGRYAGSLRSCGPAVQPVAARFGGGGHRLASGIKNLEPSALSELVQELAGLSRTPEVSES